MGQLSKANTDSPRLTLAKLMLIGDGKIGKSYYAGLPSLDGFNVLYLDGDVAAPTLMSKDFPAKAREHIYLLNCGDRHDKGALTHDFVDFLVAFTTEGKIIWSDTENRMLSKRGDPDLSNHEVIVIRPGLINPNWVLVIDSWTSLVQSAMLWAARANGVDLAEASLSQMREVYKGAGMKLTQFLVVIQRINCHVICICHPDEFVKYERPEGQRVNAIKEGDLKVLWTKMVAKSSSRPHALTMPKFFTDVAWMESNRAGTERQLDFKLSVERVGGGHFTGRESMEKYSFAKLVEQVGGSRPAEHESVTTPNGVLEIFAKGEFKWPEAAGKVLGDSAAKPAASSASSAEAAPAKPVGFAALIKSKQP